MEDGKDGARFVLFRVVLSRYYHRKAFSFMGEDATEVLNKPKTSLIRHKVHACHLLIAAAAYVIHRHAECQ